MSENDMPMRRFNECKFFSRSPDGISGYVGMGFDIDEKSFDDENRSAEITMTEETPDGVGDIVEIRGIDLRRFLKNAVLLQFHDYQRWPLGKVEGVKRDPPRLRARKVYAPATLNHHDADIGWGLTRAGILKGQSIGFVSIVAEEIEATEQRDTGYYARPRRFKKIELLELSDVPVPMHANALVGKDGEYLAKSIGADLVSINKLYQNIERVEGMLGRLLETMERSARSVAGESTATGAAPILNEWADRKKELVEMTVSRILAAGK